MTFSLLALLICASASHGHVFTTLHNLENKDPNAYFTAIKPSVPTIKGRIECAALTSILMDKTRDVDGPSLKYNAFTYNESSNDCSIGNAIPFVNPLEKSRPASNAVYGMDKCFTTIPDELNQDLEQIWILRYDNTYSSSQKHNWANITASSYTKTHKHRAVPAPFPSMIGNLVPEIGHSQSFHWTLDEAMDIREFTLTVWSYQETATTQSPLVCAWTGLDYSHGFTLFRAYNQVNRPHVLNRPFANGMASVLLKEKTWAQLTLTFSSTSGEMKLYHNGTDVVMTLTGNVGKFYAAVKMFTIGYYAGLYAKANIAQVAFFTREFKATEVEAFFHQSQTLAAPGDADC